MTEEELIYERGVGDLPDRKRSTEELEQIKESRKETSHDTI